MQQDTFKKTLYASLNIEQESWSHIQKKKKKPCMVEKYRLVLYLHPYNVSLIIDAQSITSV